MPRRKPDAPVSGFVVRERAIGILLRVAGGAHADELIERAAASFDDPRDAGLLRECVLGVLRHRSRLDFALQASSRRPLAELDPIVLEALRLGAFQMLLLERVPVSAAVDTAVEVVSRRAGPGPASFTNAVLRALSRRRGDGLAEPPDLAAPLDLATRRSHPAWLVERLAAELPPEELDAALEANNEPALIGVRPIGPGALQQDHARHQEQAPAEARSWGTPSPWLPGAWRTASIGADLLGELRAGRVYVQDEAAMLVGELCRPDGPRALVLDLCAAPGGKSLSAWLAGSRVVAADRDARRLPRLRDNLRRMTAALSAAPAFAPQCLLADGESPPFANASADLVILDAPCSGTGVIRRHPEIRWRLTPEAIARHAARQRRMIAAAAGLVRPGGALVYSVCSVLREEGEAVIGSLLVPGGAFEIEDPRPWLPPAAHELVSDDGLLRSWPHRHGLDGHIAARLRRAGPRAPAAE